MLIRVFDRENKRYYKSIVYGVVNHLSDAIVLNPYTDCFELAPHFDTSGVLYEPLYEEIQPERKDWVAGTAEDLKKLQVVFGDKAVNCLYGYEDVVGKYEFLLALLQQKPVEKAAAGIQLRIPEDEAQWNYIRTQEDADAFLKLFEGFHDSTLDQLSYEEDNTGTRKLTAVFDNSCWYGVAELCFEGLIAMNLRPALHCSRDIYCASLLVKDESIFWEEEAFGQEGSYIKALNLKWRKIGEAKGINLLRDDRFDNTASEE